MPNSSQHHRTAIGRFVWVFGDFMARRAQKLANSRVNTLVIPVSARAKDVLLLFLVTSLLLRCGDIEQNPGPGHHGGKHAKSTASVSDSEAHALRDDLLGGMKEMMEKMFSEQRESFEKSLRDVKDQISEVKDCLDSMGADVEDLKGRTKSVEDATERISHKTSENTAAIDSLEQKVEHLRQTMDDKIDKLESFSRRDNLKFFNVQESTEPENYDSCASKILSLLRKCVPGREWNLADIVRAHRLGGDNNNNNNNNRDGRGNDGGNRGTSSARPRPVIVKFAHWGAKMHVLTRGREGLKQEGVAVARDLTTRQQNTIKQYRDDGIRAYYKGNKLVVAGPFQRQQPPRQPGRAATSFAPVSSSRNQRDQRNQSPPPPLYSEVTGRAAVGGAHGGGGTTPVSGVVTRNRAQSQSTRKDSRTGSP